MEPENEKTYYDVIGIDCTFNMECSTCADYAAQADYDQEEEGDEEKKEEPVYRACTLKHVETDVNGRTTTQFVDLNHVSSLNIERSTSAYSRDRNPLPLDKALVYRTEIVPGDDNVSVSFYFVPRTKCHVATKHGGMDTLQEKINCEKQG